MHPTVQSKLSAIAIDDFSLKISKFLFNLIYFTFFFVAVKVLLCKQKASVKNLEFHALNKQS